MRSRLNRDVPQFKSVDPWDHPFIDLCVCSMPPPKICAKRIKVVGARILGTATFADHQESGYPSTYRASIGRFENREDWRKGDTYITKRRSYLQRPGDFQAETQAHNESIQRFHYYHYHLPYPPPLNCEADGPIQAIMGNCCSYGRSHRNAR